MTVDRPVNDGGVHTPGPWVASPTYPTGDWCIHARGTPWQLAYCAASTQIDWPLEANARLIAAAPDLLEALKILTANIEEAFPALSDLGPVVAARAAIARASGLTHGGSDA